MSCAEAIYGRTMEPWRNAGLHFAGDWRMRSRSAMELSTGDHCPYAPKRPPAGLTLFFEQGGFQFRHHRLGSEPKAQKGALEIASEDCAFEFP